MKKKYEPRMIRQESRFEGAGRGSGQTATSGPDLDGRSTKIEE